MVARGTNGLWTHLSTVGNGLKRGNNRNGRRTMSNNGDGNIAMRYRRVSGRTWNAGEIVDCS